MFLSFKDLSKLSSKFETWDCILPEFHRLELENCLWGYPGSDFAWSGSDAKLPGRIGPTIRLSPFDLLENAASIVEFQAFNSGAASLDPAIFARWRKRNPAYTQVFDYVAQALESEVLALRALIPLVNVAFETSEPIRAFALLLGPLWYRLRDPASRKLALESANPEAWRVLLAIYLDKIAFEAKPDADAKILGSPFHRITLNEWLGGRFGEIDGHAVEHPLISAAAQRWAEIAVRFPWYDLAIDCPGFLSKDHLDLIVDKFYPPLNVARFHLGNGKDRVVSWGNLDTASTLFRDGWIILDLLTMYSAVRRASGAHFDADHRLCHHAACSLYKSNFCNSYPNIPRSFTDCKFPQRMSQLIALHRKPSTAREEVVQ